MLLNFDLLWCAGIDCGAFLLIIRYITQNTGEARIIAGLIKRR